MLSSKATLSEERLEAASHAGPALSESLRSNFESALDEHTPVAETKPLTLDGMEFPVDVRAISPGWSGKSRNRFRALSPEQHGDCAP